MEIKSFTRCAVESGAVYVRAERKVRGEPDGSRFKTGEEEGETDGEESVGGKNHVGTDEAEGERGERE